MEPALVGRSLLRRECQGWLLGIQLVMSAEENLAQAIEPKITM